VIKNTAGQKIGAQLVTASDGSAFAGAVTVSVTIDAGTQATGSVGSGACTHEGNGYHTYAPAQAETNGTLIAFTFTGTGAAPATVQVFTTGFDVTAAQWPANTTQLAGATVAATTSVTFPAASTVATTTGAVGSVTGAVGSVTGAVGSVTGAVGSVTGNVGGNVVGSVGSVAGAVGSVTGNVGGNVVGSVASVTAGVTVTTNNDKTGYSLASGGIGSGAHAAAELNAIADALLDRNMATGTDNGTNSTAVRTVRQALRRMRNKESIAAGTLTVTKEDDSTTSWTAAVTTTAGDPLSAVDPT
jgi:hypothetical protein